jgi:hypothetical protein
MENGNDKELLENGKLTIPLHHGTSSLFLDSIREHGLGGVNPIEQLKVREYFSDVFKLCDVALAGDAEWEVCKFVPKMLMDQISKGDNANYQHGDTYLSPSRGSAIGYALTNRFGSELISNAHRLFSLVKERRPEPLDNIELMHHPLQDILEKAHKPILLKINNIPISILASEGGNSPDKTLEDIKGMLPFLNMAGVAINYNFRLLRPISFDMCEVEYLDPEKETNLFDW